MTSFAMIVKLARSSGGDKGGASQAWWMRAIECCSDEARSGESDDDIAAFGALAEKAKAQLG